MQCCKDFYCACKSSIFIRDNCVNSSKFDSSSLTRLNLISPIIMLDPLNSYLIKYLTKYMETNLKFGVVNFSLNLPSLESQAMYMF